ncbi:MAG: serine/threonine-protein kinase [Kofleriaceae bacterium]
MVCPHVSEPAGIKFGHFTLGKRLARGGMAEVFLARQRGPEGFDRRVAVKRILPHLAETADFVRMFLSEARLAARLSHPNIVHIYELGQVDGDYFIAMEFVDGIHAGQLIAHAEREPVPAELIARIGADAAGALAYAHRLEDADGRPLQLVHRDVSPHNLMVSFDGVTKLVDFGIAKAAIKADETRPGIVKGKYAYMSPEQTVGRPLDGRSDVFSLGVVLWELLAGRTIVDRGDVVEAMKVIRDGRWTPIERAAPDTPPALAQAVGWALAHKRDDRATAAQLQIALEEFLKGSPRLATPAQLAEWTRPRFPRATDDAPRGRRHTGAPPTTMPAGTAVSVVAAPPRAGTAPVVVTDAGPIVGAGPIAGGTREIAITASAVALEAVSPRPPPRRSTPPPVPVAARAPTHLDEPEEDGVGDAPTRQHQPSAPLARVSSRLDVPVVLASPRRWLALAVAVSLALAAVLALVIATRGGARTAPVDAAVATGPDAQPEIIALEVPTDAGPVDAPAALDAAPPTPTIATLEVITRPAGATVRLPGRPPVTTPVTLTLEPGAVTLAISRDGYLALTRTVTVAADEHRTLELALERERRGTPPKPAADVGYLTVRTNPYAVVMLGSRRLGETPFANVAVPVGTHVLTFTNPGRRPVKRTVMVRPGQTVKLSLQIP